MRSVINAYTFFSIFVLATFAVSSQDLPADKLVEAEFEKNIRAYTQQREALESELPRLAKQSTAEEIQAHKTALLKKVLADRTGARRGQIFTPEAELLIRKIVTNHYPSQERLELRKELAEAENKTVVVAVNAVYPETAELLEMPPTLLLALPELPKQVRYRFVRSSLLIVDRESHLIVDFMTNALP